jgi:lysozyme family protein
VGTDVDVQTQIATIIDRFEGHLFTDDPHDHGEATKFGITRALLSDYLGLPAGELCPVERVRDLTRDEAIHIGTEMIALRPGLYRIANDRLRFAVLDYAWHSGVGQAVLDLQRVLGFTAPTTHFGPRTEAAVNAGDPSGWREQVIARRLELIGKDLAHAHDQAVFALDWLRRVGSVLCYQVS